MAFQEMLYHVFAYCISDIGCVRQNNEDSCSCVDDKQLYVLADGMGGHQAGEIASKEAVKQLCFLFQQQYSPVQNLHETMEMLKNLILEVNGIVYRMGNETVGCKGMGTTLCCVFLHPEGLIYAHVGDSRIYRFTQGRLELLTKDHSLLRELIDLGQLKGEAAENFLYKNIITRAVGTEPFVEPSVQTSALEAGDILLICTDGLTDLVNFNDIQEIMTNNAEEDMAHVLVETAKKNGGYDNITIILVKIQDIYESHLP